MTSENILHTFNTVVDDDRSPSCKRVKYTNDEYDNSPNWSLCKDLDIHDNELGVNKLDGEYYSPREIPDDVLLSLSEPSTPRLNMNMLECTELFKASPDAFTINYFDMLSDEVILHIFHWIRKRHLGNIALTCKRFHRLTQDESLWTRMDISNRKLSAGALGLILSRKVVVLRLAVSEILHPPMLSDQIVSSPTFRCRLLFLDLSMAYIQPDSLVMLFNKCQRLKKLSLEHVEINTEVLKALSGNKDLEILNLAMCSGIKKEGLIYLLENCTRLRELNIAWTYLNQASIKYLCQHLPSTMDRLNLSGCRKLMNDRDVAAVVSNCPNLRELDLSDCTEITGMAVKYLTALEELNFLALSRCYGIEYRFLLILAKLSSLSFLDVHGGYITETELKVVQDTLGRRVEINKFKFSSIARPTVGQKRTSIWNMRVRE